MAKQSGYLQKLAAQQAIRDEKTRRFTLQQCKDMMLITMHEDFGWGEERLKKLSDCYDQTFMTYAEMCLADAKTDKQIWFTQGKVDERLKKAYRQRPDDTQGRIPLPTLPVGADDIQTK